MKDNNYSLTRVEWEIYNFLKKRSEENKWTSQSLLKSHLLTQGYSNELRDIRRHIANIRSCPKIQKIIITDYGKGYKLMTSEGERSKLENRRISILKMLKQYYLDVDRFNKNNQSKITFTEYERPIYESVMAIKGGE